MNQQFTKTLKEQEPQLSDHLNLPHSQFKMPHYHLPLDCFSHPYSINPLQRSRQDLLKKQHYENFDMEHYMGGFDEQNYRGPGHFDEYKDTLLEGYEYQPYMSLQPQWYPNNQSAADNIKLEEQQEQRFWRRQIRDEISNQIEDYYQKHLELSVKFEQNEPLNLKNANEELCKFINVPHENENNKSYRRLRVQAYLMKKHQRIFRKKVIYNCRKVVAENRFRYFGRFISLKQATQILMLPEGQQYTPGQIKQMLKNKNSKTQTKVERNEEKADEEKI